VNHLWRKAPLALIRYPGLFAAIVVGCLLLVVAAAAYPLFISATASDLVRSQIDRPTVTRFSAGITYEREDLSFRKPAPGGREDGPLYMRLDTLFRERAARTDLLGPTLGNIVGGTVSVSPPDHPGQHRTGRLFAGEQALQHVRILEGTDGERIWLPDLIADALDLGAGDRVRFTGRGDRSIELAVDGVYRALYTYTAELLPGYWLSWREQICGSFAACSPPPRQFMILDCDQLIRVSNALGIRSANFLWQAPLRGGMDITLEEARELQGFAERFKAEISDDRTYVGRAFECYHVLGPRLYPRLTAFRTAIDEVILDVQRRTSACRRIRTRHPSTSSSRSPAISPRRQPVSKKNRHRACSRSGTASRARTSSAVKASLAFESSVRGGSVRATTLRRTYPFDRQHSKNERRVARAFLRDFPDSPRSIRPSSMRW
jgi:hypothetical protein